MTSSGLHNLRKPRRGQACFDHTFVLIADAQVCAKQESRNKTYPLIKFAVNHLRRDLLPERLN
jgi:hypothetical protein